MNPVPVTVSVELLPVTKVEGETDITGITGKVVVPETVVVGAVVDWEVEALVEADVDAEVDTDVDADVVAFVVVATEVDDAVVEIEVDVEDVDDVAPEGVML